MLPNRKPIGYRALAFVLASGSLIACGRTESPAAGTQGDRPLFVPDTKPVPAVKWGDATVPQGTQIKLSLIDTLSSGENHKGDMFRALVTEAIMVGDRVAVPSGSNIRGVLREVVPASSQGQAKGGSLALEFSRIDTPTGANATLKARLTRVAAGRAPAELAGGSRSGVVVAGMAGQEAVLLSNVGLTLVLEEPLRIKVKE